MRQELKNYQNNPQKLIRSFGRIKSRKLSDNKKYLLENLYETYKIKEVEQFVNKKNILEIGFGFGDFLFAKAKNNPEINFFAAEPHLNGVVNLLAKLEQDLLKNIKISTTDIRILLKDFPDNFFDEIYILFPDPWPKVKHFKRRLINIDFLDNILFCKIKNNGKIIIATDHDSYKTWILAEVLRCKNFSWNANCKKDWQNFPNDWIMTKYQKKALEEGRTPVIFTLNACQK
jgi:tRNA (guanine-N7-)-methyltransferase